MQAALAAQEQGRGKRGAGTCRSLCLRRAGPSAPLDPHQVWGTPVQSRHFGDRRGPPSRPRICPHAGPQLGGPAGTCRATGPGDQVCAKRPAGCRSAWGWWAPPPRPHPPAGSGPAAGHTQAPPPKGARRPRRGGRRAQAWQRGGVGLWGGQAWRHQIGGCQHLQGQNQKCGGLLSR